MPVPHPTPLAQERAAASSRLARDRRLRLVAQRVGLAVLFLAVWKLASLGSPAFVLPGPERVFDTWSGMVATRSFWNDFGITFWRVACGFVLAVLVGVPLGLLLGANERIGEFFEPALTVINTVSSTIWAIFALIWFGLSNWTTIFVVFMTAAPLILTNVWQGTRSVNADHIELARTFRASRLMVMRTIYLPTILPPFFASARLAFGFGARVSLVAETLGASSGVGYRLRQAADLVQTDQVFAWTLTLVALMLALEGLVLKPLESRLFAWRKRAEAQ